MVDNIDQPFGVVTHERFRLWLDELGVRKDYTMIVSAILNFPICTFTKTIRLAHTARDRHIRRTQYNYIHKHTHKSLERSVNLSVLPPLLGICVPLSYVLPDSQHITEGTRLFPVCGSSLLHVL